MYEKSFIYLYINHIDFKSINIVLD